MNSTLSWRTPQQLGFQRNAVTHDDIQNWFAELQLYLVNEVVDHNALTQDPNRIWNMDESGFPLSVKKPKALATCGSKNVYNVTTETHQNITVVACCNAAGNFMPPQIIFKGERKRNIGMEDFDTALYSSSKSGWTDSSIFLSFLHEFAGHLQSSNVVRPVLLFLDGHTSHLSFEAANFAFENGILMYCLPAHSSHILQPLDVGIFSALKAQWKGAVLQWHWENPGCPMSRKDFPGTFKSVWEKACTPDKPCQGFRKTGLFPLDPTAYDATRVTVSKNPLSSTTPCDTAEILADIPFSSSIFTEQSEVGLLTQDLNTETETIVSITHLPRASSPVAEYEYPVNDIQPLDFSLSGMTSQGSTYQTASDLQPLDFSLSGITCDIDDHIQASNYEYSSFSNALPLPLQTENQLSSDSLCQVIIQSPEMTISEAVVHPMARPSNFISPAFEMLKLPETKKNNIKVSVLPKATTGKKALEILAERENQKRGDYIRKLQRKADRENKKKRLEKEKIEKALKRTQAKEKKKQEKKEAKKTKSRPKKINKIKHECLSESDSEVDDDTIVLIAEAELSETSFSKIDKESCLYCNDVFGSEEEETEGLIVGCEMCPRWAHRACTGDQVLKGLDDIGDISAYPFTCSHCDFDE